MPAARFAIPMDADRVLTCRLVSLMVQIGELASDVSKDQCLGPDSLVYSRLCVAHSLVIGALQAHEPVSSLDPASA